MARGQNTSSFGRRLAVFTGLFVFTLIMAFAALEVVLTKYPGLGAQGIDVLRQVIGDQAAAEIESVAFQAEDIFHRWRYQVAGQQPAELWNPAPDSPAIIGKAPGGPGTRQPASPLVMSLFNPRSAAARPDGPASAALAWNLPDVLPLGKAAGEGEWSPYLYDPTGRAVAARTFLQPDPQRPYALVAVVGFDMGRLRLNFVPGYDEPKSPVQAERPGRIPAGDLASGLVVAAFNGGFKAQHGHFGAMSGQVVLLPPREGLGTVGIYSDGQVKIGAWGTDIQPSANLIAWRQNGPLIIQNGVVNPHTADNAPQDWGYTVAGSITTSRSALGISKDGRTLFYAAGTDLTLPALARALQAAGAYQAIQLDINNYYVHFEAIHYVKGTPQAVPLLNSMLGSGNARYLGAEPRDFFYVSLAR
jgi:hypothetical protein